MNFLPPSSRDRLHTQPDTVLRLLDEAAPDLLTRRPASGKWAIHENLAHLGRYQEVFLERLDTLLLLDTPAFARYVADEDPEFSRWTRLSVEEVRNALMQTRKPLIDRLLSLTPEQLERQAVHPAFGVFNVVEWTEFFLLHEAHHLFTIIKLLGEMRSI